MNTLTNTGLHIQAIIIVIVWVMLCLPVRGQNPDHLKRQLELQKLVHSKGDEQFSVGAGLVKDGWNLTAGYGRYFSRSLLIGTDVSYETVQLNLTTLHAYYLSPLAAWLIGRIRNRFFADLKGGFIAGEETLTNRVMVNKPLDQLVFGEKLGLKFEYFMNPVLSLNLDLEQRFMNN